MSQIIGWDTFVHVALVVMTIYFVVVTLSIALVTAAVVSVLRAVARANGRTR
jgi:hypothetical protein